MYRLSDYLAMLADPRRVAAYARAIEALVEPGDRVIELGAGFGFFSVLAARAGAAIVDAVDLSPVIHLGPRIAEANGCADRVRFHRADLLRFVPEERADVIIGDLRGPTPFASRSLEIMIDARRRMLREGGRLIGRKDVMYVAPARQPDRFRRLIARPLDNADVKLSPVASVALDTPFQCALEPADVLAPGVPWCELDYERLEATSHTGGAQWRAGERLHVEGLAVWFSADLGAGAGFTTAPVESVAPYGQLFLPLAQPVHVEAVECLRVDVGARCSAGQYVWTWRVEVSDARGVARFSSTQNSLAERIIDPAAFETAAL